MRYDKKQISKALEVMEKVFEAIELFSTELSALDSKRAPYATLGICRTSDVTAAIVKSFHDLEAALQYHADLVSELVNLASMAKEEQDDREALNSNIQEAKKKLLANIDILILPIMRDIKDYAESYIELKDEYKGKDEGKDRKVKNEHRIWGLIWFQVFQELKIRSTSKVIFGALEYQRFFAKAVNAVWASRASNQDGDLTEDLQKFNDLIKVRQEDRVAEQEKKEKEREKDRARRRARQRRRDDETSQATT